MKTLYCAMTLLFFALRPAISAEAAPTLEAEPVVVHLSLKCEEKVRKDLAYYLKGELESLEGVTVTEAADLPADYELSVMQVNEPLGRMALSLSFVRPFNQKDNLASYKKLLADHWKGGMKDEAWTAFEDYFKPYGVTVSRQLLTGRKSKMRELCANAAESFAHDVLKRPVEATPTPGE